MEPNWNTKPGTQIDGYDATPPSVNLKCIVFTLIIVVCYWFLPSKNIIILAILLYLPYLLMAWYDHHYDCKRNSLGPTFLKNFYDWAKPYYSKQNIAYRNWHPKWLRLINIVDIIIFILIILSIYIFRQRISDDFKKLF